MRCVIPVKGSHEIRLFWDRQHNHRPQTSITALSAEAALTGRFYPWGSARLTPGWVGWRRDNKESRTFGDFNACVIYIWLSRLTPP